jgi:membrane protease YdiL (CAAX protease family)
VNWTFLLTTSILEEIAFRYFLQTFLLAKVAKSARIVLTSTMFALVHIVRFGHFRGMLGHQFLSGLYFSVRREQSASITELSAIHFMMNAYSVYLNGGLIGK